MNVCIIFLCVDACTGCLFTHPPPFEAYASLTTLVFFFNPHSLMEVTNRFPRNRHCFAQSWGVSVSEGIRIFICKYRVFVPCLVSLVCRFTSLVYNEKSCMAKFSRFIFYINLFRFDGLNTSDVFLFLICCVRYRLQISFLISKFILYPRNHQKTCGFLRISGATEVD